jgi:hypothetical protein
MKHFFFNINIMNNNIPDELVLKHKKYVNRLPINQQSALRQYINSSSYLNQLLRDGFDNGNEEHCKFYGAEMKQRVQNMDNALMSSELEKINRSYTQFVVYRGINSNELGRRLENNGYIHHPHYMSTSRNKDVAQKSFAGTCCTFCIVVDPRDNDCPVFCYISSKKSGKDGIEEEVLFERNCFLNFIQKTDDGIYLVYVSKRKPSNQYNSVNSCNVSNHVVISQDDVEDELAFLDDEEANAPVDLLVRRVSDSLKLTYKSLDIDTIQTFVRGHLLNLQKALVKVGGHRKKSSNHSKKYSKAST